MTFQPGVSGNPGGRPPVIDHAAFKQRLQKEFAEDIVQAFRDGLKSPRTRIECAKYLSDRIYGKPEQPIANASAVPFKIEMIVPSAGICKQ